MSIKHTEISFDGNNPFSNCKLGREKYSTVLTSIIDSYPNGFVLALDNKWGTGKTTFLKMWQQSLISSGYQTVLFNAWENDFEDNPMVALIGELKILDNNKEDKYKRVIKNAAKLTKNVVPAVFKAILNRYIDSEILAEGLVESAKTATEIFENDIEEYATRKASIREFRTSLQALLKTKNGDKPLVFFIDELDRCRPNYSVMLLEQIKHLFSVPNIVFVLAIDKEQLGNAIRGYYGSDRMDAVQYLKRFIDIEYSLPEPQPGVFFEYLFLYFDFDAFFLAEERKKHSTFAHDRSDFAVAGKLFLGRLSLREQEKIMAHTRLVFRTLQYNNYLIPTLLIFLIFIKSKHTSFYDSLQQNQLSIANAQNKFHDIVKDLVKADTKRILSQIEAYMLRFYERSLSRNIKSEIFDQRADNREYELTLPSKIDSVSFLAFLTSDKMLQEYSEIHLADLTEKINLVNPIRIN